MTALMSGRIALGEVVGSYLPPTTNTHVTLALTSLHDARTVYSRLYVRQDSLGRGRRLVPASASTQARAHTRVPDTNEHRNRHGTKCLTTSMHYRPLSNLSPHCSRRSIVYEAHLLIELPLVIKNFPKFHLMSSPEQAGMPCASGGFSVHRASTRACPP